MRFLPLSGAGLATALVATTSVAAQAPAPSAPRAVVREALAAVEGDSAAALAARWEARLRRDPRDRSALLGLATLDRLTYRHADADRRYRALQTSGGARDPIAIHAHLGQAQGFMTRHMLDSARAHLERSRALARATGDRGTEAEAMLDLSSVLVVLGGDGRRELAMVDTAGRLLDAGAEPRARFHQRRAQILWLMNDPAAAQELAACLAAARPAGLRRLEVVCTYLQARLANDRGQRDSAITAMLALIERAGRLRDQETVVRIREAVVGLIAAKGRYGEMRRHARTLAAEARAIGNLSSVSTSYRALGDLAIRQSDFAAAAEALDSAVAIAHRIGHRDAEMNARVYRPILMAADGDVEGARRELVEILAYFEATGSRRSAAATHRLLALVLSRGGRHDEAARALEAARAYGLRNRMDAWVRNLTDDVGRLALRRGDLGAAERHFREYLELLDANEQLDRYEIRAHLAEIHARRGDLARAERELLAAADELDTWRAALDDDALRVQAFQTGSSWLTHPRTGVSTVIAALAAGGRAEGAFLLAERGRARELSDRLLRAAVLAPDATDASASAGADRRARSPAAAAPVAPVVLAQLTAALPDDRTALLEYVAAPDAPTTLFVLTRAGLRAHVLPPIDSLVAPIDRFVAQLESGTDPRALARALGDAVLAPALRELDPAVTHLVVAADGALHRLPFDALRLSDDRLALERFTIGHAPSAAVFAGFRRRPADARTTARTTARTAGRVLAFGDPDFAAGPAGDASPAGVAVALREGLGRLPASGDEAREAARYGADAVVRLRAEASEAFLKRAPLAEFSVIHFATHALVDDRSLERTALALAPGAGEDGFVAPADLAALGLDADLVVLSACRTAGGVLVAGEGVQGLAAPLLAAGARSVVATQWRVGDRRTAELVEAFYAALARGLPVAEALRSAKLAALERGAPASDWAAFTVIGDPLAEVALAAPSARPAPWRWGLLGAGLVMVAGVGAMLKRRRGRE